MTVAVLAHWAVEMIATGMYIALAAICTNPKHHHNKILVWMGKHRLITQAVLALPVAWITVVLIDSVLIGSGATNGHEH